MPGFAERLSPLPLGGKPLALRLITDFLVERQEGHQMDTQAATSQLKPYLSFPFRHGEARSRFVVGAALLFGGLIVPIIPGIIVYGYVLRILRSTAEGDAPSMPAWDDWSSYLSVGFRGAIVNLVFSLPALLVFILGFSLYFGTFFLIPFTSTPDARGSEPAIALVFIGMAIMFLTMAVGFVFLILGAIPLPASLSHFVMKDQLGAAFRVREWWPIVSTNWLGYFISFVIVAGILGIVYFGFLALYYTLVLVCVAYVLMMPITFYTMLVAASLFGDAYREGANLSQMRREVAELSVSKSRSGLSA